MIGKDSFIIIVLKGATVVGISFLPPTNTFFGTLIENPQNHY